VYRYRVGHCQEYLDDCLVSYHLEYSTSFRTGVLGTLKGVDKLMGFWTDDRSSQYRGDINCSEIQGVFLLICEHILCIIY
jgi:hypothetical protein